MIASCILITIVILFMVFSDDKPGSTSQVSVEEAIQNADSSNTNASNKYDNLVIHDYKTSLGDIKEVYNLKIMTDKSYLNRTFIENFKRMDAAIDKFFMEEFDKSYIIADFHIDGKTVEVGYNDIEKTCNSEAYDGEYMSYLFGNNTKQGGYMVQISESMINTWFSRYGLQSIHPSMKDYIGMYLYVSGNRQVDDADIKLKDGVIKLSEFEKKVLAYITESFPLETSDNVEFCIGDIRMIANGEYEAACFKLRRSYKGIPFEYGSNSSAGGFIDAYNHDAGELTYVESTHPDTMLSFGKVSGKVVETDTITDIISLDSAYDILSKKIGDNSVYDVYGVELVYRECVTKDKLEDGVDAVLKPMWKFITVNQNDDKYTLFYIDVVTGDITERFEYYYK